MVHESAASGSDEYIDFPPILRSLQSSIRSVPAMTAAYMAVILSQHVSIIMSADLAVIVYLVLSQFLGQAGVLRLLQQGIPLQYLFRVRARLPEKGAVLGQ